MNEQHNIKNQKQLRNAILKAKGGKRSNKEFAKLCGFTGPTFCRLVNMKFTRKSSLEKLIRIAEVKLIVSNVM